MRETIVSTGRKVLAGLLAGTIASFVSGSIVPSALGFNVNLALGATLGIIFGLFFDACIRTAGTGLIWGQAFGLLWWLFGSLTIIPLLSGQGLSWTAARAQEALPLLLGWVIGYGGLLGLSYYGLTWVLDRGRRAKTSPPAEQSNGKPVRQTIVPQLVQAAIVGGLGGLLGSWVFARGVETAEFFPLVAGLMGSNAMAIGRVLHYTIGITIGTSFALLFSRDIQGLGSSLVWGLDYGLIWWIVGPMTLLPILLGLKTQPDWSLHAAQANVPSLVAHMLYGAIVGLFYGLANKVWRVLFVDSDPVNRALEGPGSLGLRIVMMGLGSGVVGGLLFTAVMVGTGALSQVAGLLGAQSTVAGLIVHLIIAIIVGVTFGLLFGQETLGYGTGLAWGTVYGLWWWLLGAATLFPLLLQQPVDWSLETVVGLYPSLIGHLLYGIGLGLFFQFLARRYNDEVTIRSRRGFQGDHLSHKFYRSSEQQETGQPAPALWIVTLVMGVVMPLLLSMDI
jgi:uncharacterized membrane protein YagU involved in acid resistance